MSSLRCLGKALAGLLLPTLLATGCEPPPVVPTADQQQQTRTARIEGSVVVQGSARGNAVVFLYDALRPPPPQGSGRPVAFTLIPMEELYGAEVDKRSAGPFTAPFVFPLVRPGNYLLRGFIDVDTCRMGEQPCHGPDFIPWYNVTAEPNLGDVPGATVDLATRAPRVIEVGTTADGTPLPVMGVTVSFSDSTLVAADRPAFDVVGSATIDPSAGLHAFKLRAHPIPRQGVVDLAAPIFLVRLVDENRDGIPDDANRDGAPDLWPRVVVRKLAETGAGITDENDADNNGVLDEQGADYVHTDGTTDGKPDLVVLAAALLANPLLAQLHDSEGRPVMDRVLPLSELNMVLRPMAVDVSNPAMPASLRGLPAGRYGVIVIQSTGQVWRVPNELSPQLAPGLGLPPIEGQGFFFQVR